MTEHLNWTASRKTFVCSELLGLNFISIHYRNHLPNPYSFRPPITSILNRGIKQSQQKVRPLCRVTAFPFPQSTACQPHPGPKSDYRVIPSSPSSAFPLSEPTAPSSLSIRLHSHGIACRNSDTEVVQEVEVYIWADIQNDYISLRLLSSCQKCIRDPAVKMRQKLFPLLTAGVGRAKLVAMRVAMIVWRKSILKVILESDLVMIPEYSA